MAGVAVVLITLAELPATAGIVPGVVVVVVVTERVGAGGGGDETMCDSGSVAQPAKRPRMPQQVITEVSCRTVRTGVERDKKGDVLFFTF
jgi:hypothetical protein